MCPMEPSGSRLGPIVDNEVNVLVVEDDPLIAAHLEAIVESRHDRKVSIAADAETALSLAESLQPPVAIVDVRLKGAIDGLTVGRELKETFGTTLVFVTAHLDEAVRHFPERGVLFVGKPFLDQDVLKALDQALESRKARHS